MLMVSVCTSINIQAAAKNLFDIYKDYENWDRLFPLTIEKARLIRVDDNKLTIEVTHKSAGKVVNVLTFLSSEKIKLEEFKPLYNAVFINAFESAANESCYRIVASVKLKGFYKILEPFISVLVKYKIKKFVLLPMKNYAEHKVSHQQA